MLRYYRDSKFLGLSSVTIREQEDLEGEVVLVRAIDHEICYTSLPVAA